AERLLGRKLCQSFAEAARGEGIDGDEIDRSCHGRLQAFDRKAADGADAGFARRQLGPVVGLARAERGHDPHAGDDDDGPAEFVPWCCHGIPPLEVCAQRIASTSAIPSPRQWPAPTTTIWVGGFDISTSNPLESFGGNKAPREIESAASASPSGNCDSMRWP